MQCELRQKAVKVIERQGWGTEWLVNSDGNVCLLGALGVAAGVFDLEEVRRASPASVQPFYDRLEESQLIRDTIRAMFIYSNGLYSAYSFNDALGRTQDEVIAKLREGCEEVSE